MSRIIFPAIYLILSFAVRLEAAHGYGNTRITKINERGKWVRYFSTKTRKTAKEGQMTSLLPLALTFEGFTRWISNFVNFAIIIKIWLHWLNISSRACRVRHGKCVLVLFDI